MAVGRRPKLTMPILARINFLHKNDPNLFCILNSKWSKNIWLAYIWPVGSRAFDQNGPPHGALTKWDGNFFHKRYPLWILILYRKMFSNVKIGPVWADWPTPPFVQNGPHCRAVNTWVGHFFHKTDPHFNSDFVWENVEKFSNWSILGRSADPPIFQNGPQNGASNTWVGNFFHKTDPLWIWILWRENLKNFKIGQFWADWQTPQYV